MGAGKPIRQTPERGHLLQWQRRYPYLFCLSWVIRWSAAELRKILAVIFAPWPSMHDPIKYLLNAADKEEADKLTDKWTDGKLKELQYVGLSVRMFNLESTPIPS